LPMATSAANATDAPSSFFISIASSRLLCGRLLCGC
jgi:hypothetical protein